MYTNKILEEENRKTKIVHSKKYLDWLVDFTDSQPNFAWDDEAIEFSPYCSNYDKKYVALFSIFQTELEKLAKEQFVVSLPTNKYEYLKYHFKLRGNFYETIILDGNGRISTLKKITTPCKDYIYVDEKIPAAIKKEREFIEFILINEDIELKPSQYAVHIAHACTNVSISESKKEKFKIWYQDEKNQKKIILKTNEKYLNELSEKFFPSYDSGHNGIPENTLVAVSLGILSRKEAEQYTKNCTLWT